MDPYTAPAIHDLCKVVDDLKDVIRNREYRRLAEQFRDFIRDRPDCLIRAYVDDHNELYRDTVEKVLIEEGSYSLTLVVILEGQGQVSGSISDVTQHGFSNSGSFVLSFKGPTVRYDGRTSYSPCTLEFRFPEIKEG